VTTADKTPYAVTITVGVDVSASSANAASDTTVVDLTPAEVTVESVVALVAASGLTPADLRSRTVVAVGGDSRAAVAVYAVLVGLAGRYLDISDGTKAVPAETVVQSATRWPSDPRPSEPLLLAQIGADHPQLRTVGLAGALQPDEVAVVSYSRRLRFVPADDPMAALLQLVAIAAIRRRGIDDRLPHLVHGDEVVSASARDALNVGVDLELLRRAGQELRRRALPDRGALVDIAVPDERNEHLLRAADADIATVMLRLGARLNEETGLWHCPRPDRHTNGDANASMKLSSGRIRCFRCDTERVDPLRLVIDTLGCSADEAADWILDAASAA
jgi:hypothetical protein